MKIKRRTPEEAKRFEEEIKKPKCFICSESIDENDQESYVRLTGDLKRHVGCAPGSRNYAKKFNGQYQSVYCQGIKMEEFNYE
jgi:hypothetical protein